MKTSRCSLQTPEYFVCVQLPIWCQDIRYSCLVIAVRLTIIRWLLSTTPDQLWWNIQGSMHAFSLQQQGHNCHHFAIQIFFQCLIHQIIDLAMQDKYQDSRQMPHHECSAGQGQLVMMAPNKCLPWEQSHRQHSYCSQIQRSSVLGLRLACPKTCSLAEGLDDRSCNQIKWIPSVLTAPLRY